MLEDFFFEDSILARAYVYEHSSEHMFTITSYIHRLIMSKEFVHEDVAGFQQKRI